MDSSITVAIIGFVGATIGGVIAGFFATVRFFREEKSQREIRIDEREARFWARVDEREADYEKQIASLKEYYERQLASLRASMVEMQRTIDALQAENERLRGNGK